MYIVFQPTLRDPLERKNLYIKTGPFGDSLFAKSDISSGDLVAYINGFWYDRDEINWSNMTVSEQYETFFDLNWFELYLDIVLLSSKLLSRQYDSENFTVATCDSNENA